MGDPAGEELVGATDEGRSVDLDLGPKMVILKG